MLEKLFTQLEIREFNAGVASAAAPDSLQNL